MSIETDTATETDQPIEELAESLGEAIAALPEYEAFLEAREAVETDEEAQSQIAEFERARRHYMDARQRGAATRDDLREMQQKQEELHEIPVMREFLQVENDLERRLQAINAHINDPLEIDFGDKSSGCCND